MDECCLFSCLHISGVNLGMINLVVAAVVDIIIVSSVSTMFNLECLVPVQTLTDRFGTWKEKRKSRVLFWTRLKCLKLSLPRERKPLACQEL